MDSPSTWKIDLLNPLATLHWKNCHKPPWRSGYYPTHCAALRDTVVVLTSDITRKADILFFSSTDLHSWNSINLPYQYMSLSIYQSKFVLVGGRHPSTGEPTNIIFTSTTGQNWESSLPSMLSKRYQTSSVSTRSPEVLVVAGGRGSFYEELDTVEIFINSKWVTTHNLPVPASWMSSAFHDGRLYLMKRGRQNNTVFICNCTSLISSSTKSSGTTSTNKEIWRQFQAPGGWGSSVASYLSRLVIIDEWERVRGYSMAGSWVMVTSIGPALDGDGITAATVLKTEEIVVAHQLGGVYRGTVSVSPFSPDRRFLSDDLTRLEEVMGIQIMSVLANHVSQLASLSGMTPLPEPQSRSTECVEKLISQWCAGLSSVSPTWKHLLEVISGVGLTDLCKQIEAFMKGEWKYINAYHHFISTKKVLEMLFLKILFSGPPRLGKTTAHRRLMGEIVDLMSAGEADAVRPSTRAVESGSDMIVKSVSTKTAVLTKDKWYAVKSHTDEARMLFHKLMQNIETIDVSTTSPQAVENVDTISVGGATATTTSQQPTERESEQNTLVPTPNISSSVADIPFIIDLFKKASEHPEFLEDMQHYFRAYLRMEDTGGQPELMDMLPALTIGPGLYLVFFNLEWNLKKEFKVFYQHTSGKTTTPEESKITLEEMLLSTLSSISCSSDSACQLRGKEIYNSNMREILETSKSVAYLVGTHKDKVSEEHISQLDEDLQSIIRGTDFFNTGLVKFGSEGKLIVTMDNMKGGVEEVKAIREMLDTAMERHFKPLRVPAVWLLFNLCLHQTHTRTVGMKNVLDLSSQFNMSAEETKVALWFLHHHAGVMMYFPSVPLLQDFVILDTQVVYDSITFLVLRAMSFDNVGQTSSEKFRETGQFVLKDLVAATSRVSGGDLIPPEKLIALLEFLHIIATIPRVPRVKCSQSSAAEQETVYLMPCVLCIASKEKLDVICNDKSRPQYVAPLMVRYKCGFVPLGIFPALIASLISHKSFHLVQRGMMKNRVQFRFQPLKTLVSFLCYPRFYAIVISELTISESEVHKECVAIRQQVVVALQQIGSHMNYGCFLDYQFAFECPSHPGKEHLCVVEEQSEVTKLMECLEHLGDRIPKKMGSVHTVWWNESQPGSLEATASSKQGSTTGSSAVRNLKCGKIMRLFRGNFPCTEARKLGTFLDLPYTKLQDFSHNNTGNVEGLMIDVLNYWLETDQEKSWTKLAEAVEDCGYGVLAEKIRQNCSQ